MAIGDQTDIQQRLRQLIPHGWFPNGLSPLRDALLLGLANILAFGYSLLAYVRLQTRISTATDGFLDMIAADFFGSSLTRGTNQTDASFRARILSNIFRERTTRHSVASVLTQLTGRAPVIFEPARPADTGGYGTNSLGYSIAGGYGSLSLPMQGFVTAFRPFGTGVPYVAGYGISTGGYSTPSQADYVSISQFNGAITDADIYAAVESVRPIGYTLWVRILSQPAPGPAFLDQTFYLDSSQLV
jgi:hypothetical protein